MVRNIVIANPNSVCVVGLGSALKNKGFYLILGI